MFKYFFFYFSSYEVQYNEQGIVMFVKIKRSKILFNQKKNSENKEYYSDRFKRDLNSLHQKCLRVFPASTSVLFELGTSLLSWRDSVGRVQLC